MHVDKPIIGEKYLLGTNPYPWWSHLLLPKIKILSSCDTDDKKNTNCYWVELVNKKTESQQIGWAYHADIKPLNYPINQYPKHPNRAKKQNILTDTPFDCKAYKFLVVAFGIFLIAFAISLVIISLY